jgi:hypothetical protein
MTEVADITFYLTWRFSILRADTLTPGAEVTWALGLIGVCSRDRGIGTPR